MYFLGSVLKKLSFGGPGPRQAWRAYSLVELLVVVALAGILLRAALPFFTSVIESHYRNTVTNRLMEDLAMARLQAVALSSSTALCPSVSSSAVTYTCGSSTGWSNGWYVYAGSSSALTAASATAGAVLRAPQPLPSGWVVDAHLPNPGNFLALSARSETSQFGHFTIYRSGYSKVAGCVTVSSTGRARSNTDDVSSGVVSFANDPC